MTMRNRWTTALAIAGLLSLCGADVEECEVVRHNPPPENTARGWAHEMGLEVVGVQCAGTDSDGDGYVSCDLSLRGDKVQIVQIQCAPARDTRDTSGCKSARTGANAAQ